MPTASEFDLLLVIAQMAVAFAGFASLASVLGERNNLDDRRVDAGRLKNMLVASLATAMLALVPFLPVLFGGTENLVWQTSAIAALATCAVVMPSVVMRGMRMKQYAGFSSLVNRVNLGIAALAVLAFVLCALGLPRVQAGGCLRRRTHRAPRHLRDPVLPGHRVAAGGACSRLGE